MATKNDATSPAPDLSDLGEAFIAQVREAAVSAVRQTDWRPIVRELVREELDRALRQMGFATSFRGR